MRPFISFTWSSNIWLSTNTSISGKVVIRGCMFFIREASPTIFCGIRLHIESHCSSRNSCVNCSFSSLFVSSASFFAATASLRCKLWKVMPSDESFKRGTPAGCLSETAAEPDAAVCEEEAPTDAWFVGAEVEVFVADCWATEVEAARAEVVACAATSPGAATC